jgi:hypothetical protein
MLLLYAIPVGILAGLASGGAIARLAATRIRLAPLALSGLLFQLLLFSPPVASVLALAGGVGPMLYVGSTVLVLVALAFNVSQSGFRLILAGAALNLVAIVANGGYMPASPDAWAALHGATAIPANLLTNSTIAAPTTALAFLGDIFYVPRPLPLANIFSIGDALIAAGGAWFIARTMAGSRAMTMPGAPRMPANG